MDHTYGAIGKEINLRPLMRSDIQNLRNWRNDRELSEYLRPIDTISEEMQKVWYDSYLNDCTCLFFSIIDKKINMMIGTVAVYNINDKKAEIGKIIIGDINGRGKGYGYLAIILAMKLGNECLGIDSYKLDCHECNLPALKTYIRAGFVETGKHPFVKGGHEIEMSINKKSLQEQFSINPQITVLEDYCVLNQNGGEIHIK